jgi:HPr kinase/phosphorylase
VGTELKVPGRRDGAESQVHAALVEVLGVGVLLRGASGVGKSECALELVRRGHRLVSDDVVRLRVTKAAEEDAARVLHDPDAAPGEAKHILLGWGPVLIRHYIEIRGIGLLYVPDLYGRESVLDEARVELICQLEQWQEGAEYERIGLSRPREVMAGVPIPALTLPVHPARNIATLVEVGVRDHLQRGRGVNAARRLDARMKEAAEREADGGDET